MDHARKIGKPEKPFPWRKTPSPPCSISDAPLIEDEEVTEDRRLANWRKWTADRRKHYAAYTAYTGREVEDLLMNTPEVFRRTVETRNLMECARDPKRVGEFAGDAGFWLTPEVLPKHGNTDLPDVPITLTKRQLGAAPEVERIALPELIQREKGLLIRDDQEPPGNRSGHSRSRTHQLSRKFKLLEPKEPEMEKLAVRGHRLGRTVPEAPKIPIVTITGVTASESSARSADPEDAIVMKIQDRIFDLSDKQTGNEDHCRFTLIFKSSGSSAVERTIRLENRGTHKIIYRWRHGSQGSNLVTPTARGSPFFFNKNRDLLLPGQVAVLRVWFRSPEPCSAAEHWTLKTSPRMSLAPLTFRLWGCCSFAPVDEHDLDPGSIERYLDRRIRESAIHGIIRGILDDVGATGPPQPAYKSLFVEREIFLANNPAYFYHPTAVRELRTIYDNATTGDSPDWNSSLDDLRRVLLELKSPRDRKEALLRFGELCRDCLAPSLYDPPGASKTSMVRNLLCSFANKFEAEAEHVRAECSRGSGVSRTRSDRRGDTPGSASASGTSQVSLARRRRSKKISQSGKSTRSTSKQSISTTTDRDPAPLASSAEMNSNECVFYREAVHVRLREMLRETVGAVCGIVDSVNNLDGPGK